MIKPLAAAAALCLFAAAAAPAPAATKDSVVLGIVLEPPGLDPTVAPAAAIGEIVHYNVLEGLTRIRADGSVAPLLAERWQVDDEGKRYTFALKQGVKFHDGAAFDASDVKFSFERAQAAGSTNKAKKALFDNIRAIDTPDPATVVLHLRNADGQLLFRLGENTAVILDPASAADTASRPVGTGPFRFVNWKRGSAVSLAKWDGFRDAAQVKLARATFRFINDPAARVAALQAGDVDGVPRLDAPQAVKALQADPRLQVSFGPTAGKIILALNQRRKPFDDVRVRRALAHAIDRRAFIEGVLDGYGEPIGSHMAPADAGYVDLTGVTPYDPAKARDLLKQAGVATPLQVTLTLPPPQYARKGGEVLAAMLAKVGVLAKIANVEWAQWLSGAFKGQFEMTVINHVEPLDYAIYSDPAYYFGYDSAPFRDLVARHAAAIDPARRAALFAELQRRLADDAANVFIANPGQQSVARKGLTGLWSSSPIFANDLRDVAWQ